MLCPTLFIHQADFYNAIPVVVYLGIMILQSQLVCWLSRLRYFIVFVSFTCQVPGWYKVATKELHTLKTIQNINAAY
jgi:hypothetical protein